LEKGTVSLKGYPVCSEHGTMNKVNPLGLWRCLTCHVGFDEQRGFLKDSTEGFKDQQENDLEKHAKSLQDIQIEFDNLMPGPNGEDSHMFCFLEEKKWVSLEVALEAVKQKDKEIELWQLADEQDCKEKQILMNYFEKFKAENKRLKEAVADMAEVPVDDLVARVRELEGRLTRAQQIAEDVVTAWFGFCSDRGLSFCSRTLAPVNKTDLHRLIMQLDAVLKGEAEAQK